MTDLAIRRDLTLGSAPAPTEQCTDAPPLWFYRYNPFRRTRISDEQLRHRLEVLVEADEALRAATTTTSDLLHDLIGATDQPEERKRLIALRRLVHRGRPVPEGDDRAATREWSAALTARDQAVEDLREDYAAALCRERQGLARQLADPALQSSLELVAPQVAKQAVRYRDAVAATGQAPARVLKSERGLLQYAVRAAVRTSPLAQLTAVGLTTPGQGGSHPDRPMVVVERSFFSLDRVMLDYVVGGFEQAAGRHEDDPHVGIPPTAAVQDGRLLFMRRTPAGYARAVVSMTPPLADIVAELSLGAVPWNDLLGAVEARLRRAGRPPVARDALGRVLGAALEHGMLCTTHPTTDADLVDLSPRGIADLDETLHSIDDQLQQLAEAPTPERRDRLDRLDADLVTLSHRSGRPAKITVSEERLGRLAPIDPGQWSALDDLGPAVELLQTFDWLADVSVTLANAFVRRHGEGARTNLVAVADDLVADVTATAQQMTGLYTNLDTAPDDLAHLDGPDGTLADLFRVRRDVEAWVGRELDAAVEAGLPEVVLDPRQVEEALSALPARLRRRPLGYGVLVQSLGDQLVVNDGLPGHGMLYSRFLGADRALGGHGVAALGQRLTRHYGEPGVRVVEDRSVQGLNVNVHPAVLPDVLEARDWSRLELAHDPATHSLQVYDGDQPIKVLPLGGGHPGLYPPALSVASGLVIAGRLYNSLPENWASRRLAAAQDTRRPTTKVPRIRVGRVVVSRGRWVPGQDLTEALAEPHELDRLVALARWRASYDVPEQIMVKSAPADSGPASVGSPDAQAARFKAKPQYVDLGSALCARVLPRMLERRGEESLPGAPDSPSFYIEEATPGITDGTHAAEWVVEVHRPAHGRFTYGGSS